MANDVITELDRRLTAARPAAADPTAYACDPDLLARLRAMPVDSRRALPAKLATPAVAGVAVVLAGALLLGGGPARVGTPSAAAAVTQALHWMTPAPGTILHTRSIESDRGSQIVREFWESGDDPSVQRQRTTGGTDFEFAADGFYDPATNTIYTANRIEMPSPTGGVSGSDPIVTKVRMLLADGQMTVGGLVQHDGVDAWPVSLKPGLGRTWTLWVAASDGKPLELRDGSQVVRWTTYETTAGGRDAAVLSVRGAHPDARVVTDPEAAKQAADRLQGVKSEAQPQAKG